MADFAALRVPLRAFMVFAFCAASKRAATIGIPSMRIILGSPFNCLLRTLVQNATFIFLRRLLQHVQEKLNPAIELGVFERTLSSKLND
jgi:hypothetical protein